MTDAIPKPMDVADLNLPPIAKKGTRVWVIDKVYKTINTGWVKEVQINIGIAGQVRITYTITRAHHYINHIGDSGYEFRSDSDIYFTGPSALNALVKIMDEAETEEGD